MASRTAPTAPTPVPASSPAEMGWRSSQAPPARNSGVADTKSRECVRLVACTLYTQVPKCTHRQAPEAASSGACRGGTGGAEGRGASRPGCCVSGSWQGLPVCCSHPWQAVPVHVLAFQIQTHGSSSIIAGRPTELASHLLQRAALVGTRHGAPLRHSSCPQQDRRCAQPP